MVTRKTPRARGKKIIKRPQQKTSMDTIMKSNPGAVAKGIKRKVQRQAWDDFSSDFKKYMEKRIKKDQARKKRPKHLQGKRK